MDSQLLQHEKEWTASCGGDGVARRSERSCSIISRGQNVKTLRRSSTLKFPLHVTLLMHTLVFTRPDLQRLRNLSRDGRMKPDPFGHDDILVRRDEPDAAAIVFSARIGAVLDAVRSTAWLYREQPQSLKACVVSVSM